MKAVYRSNNRNIHSAISSCGYLDPCYFKYICCNLVTNNNQLSSELLFPDIPKLRIIYLRLCLCPRRAEWGTGHVNNWHLALKIAPKGKIMKLLNIVAAVAVASLVSGAALAHDSHHAPAPTPLNTVGGGTSGGSAGGSASTNGSNPYSESDGLSVGVNAVNNKGSIGGNLSTSQNWATSDGYGAAASSGYTTSSSSAYFNSNGFTSGH